MGEGDTLINVLIGTAVTVVLSFTGFSPLVGGGVAGYLQRGDRMGGARVGAVVGLLATIPVLLLLGVIFGFVFTGPMMVGRMEGMAGTNVLGLFGAFFLVAVVVSLIWNVALGAVGGYLGVYVATETDQGSGRGRR